MTIQEAIESGKRFKRPGDNKWRESLCIRYSFNAPELLSYDWIIEEEKITITEAQLAAAWDAMMSDRGTLPYSTRPGYFEVLKEALGFK